MEVIRAWKPRGKSPGLPDSPALNRFAASGNLPIVPAKVAAPSNGSHKSMDRAITSVPVSRNEHLDRRAKLWSLIQGINPETANLDEIAAEKATLHAYERVAADGEGGVYQMIPWTDHSADFLAPDRAKAILDWVKTRDLNPETGKCAFGPVTFHGKIWEW